MMAELRIVISQDSEKEDFMAKAFFKFDLNEPDDLQEFHCMSKAKNLAAAFTHDNV